MISSSQLGAKEKHVANSIKLMNGPDVKHYWDGESHLGAAVQHFVPGLDIPAWDLWMLYPPGVEWGPEAAPEPSWWEHQLSFLRPKRDDRWLDAPRFAAKARELATAGQSGR